MEKKIITISREFGSGGRTIGHLVAEKLGIPFYDKELVDQIALESGFAPKYVEEHGEHAPGRSFFCFCTAPDGETFLPEEVEYHADEDKCEYADDGSYRHKEYRADKSHPAALR